MIKLLQDVTKIIVPEREKYSSHIFHQYTVRVLDGRRDELKKHLEGKKIPSMIYYPGPLHLQEAYRYLGYSEQDFPVTNTLCREVLSLPMHTEMDSDQLEYITGSILEFFETELIMEREYFAHETAVIDKGCKIGKGTKIWHFSHVMTGSEIGENCNIGQNVVVSPGVRLGKKCKGSEQCIDLYRRYL